MSGNRPKPKPKPPKPGKRIGRVQRQIIRAFIASNGQPLVTRELIQWCYPRLDRFQDWHRWNTRRAALKVAAQIGLDGRRMMWRARSDTR